MTQRTRIIITDLTRFKPGNPRVCTAGVTEDGTFIRPYPPYLSASECERLDVHPGGILEGEFSHTGGDRPHIEDATYRELKYCGACSSDEFRDALESGLHSSLADGFEHKLPRGEKCIPIEAKPPRSIITVKIRPTSFTITQNHFDTKKLQAHFSDESGSEFAFLSVTDRGFYDQAMTLQDDPGQIAQMAQFIQSQDALYLRIGLSRAFTAGDRRHGYWIQVNGIYTFPKYLEYIRCYSGTAESV